MFKTKRIKANLPIVGAARSYLTGACIETSVVVSTSSEDGLSELTCKYIATIKCLGFFFFFLVHFSLDTHHRELNFLDALRIHCISRLPSKNAEVNSE